MSSYSASRAFGVDEISTFLRAVDRHLGAPARVEIIGGGAAAFHAATTTTNDIDTFNEISAALSAAILQATAETGLRIPVSHAAIADILWNAQDRLERQFAELMHLEVWVLEKHDLALSKAMRGNEHDEQQLLEIHQGLGLDLDILVTRYRDEMRHVIGDPLRLRFQFLQLIELLFGELKRVAAERLLREANR